MGDQENDPKGDSSEEVSRKERRRRSRRLRPARNTGAFNWFVQEIQVALQQKSRSARKRSENGGKCAASRGRGSSRGRRLRNRINFLIWKYGLLRFNLLRGTKRRRSVERRRQLGVLKAPSSSCKKSQRAQSLKLSRGTETAPSIDWAIPSTSNAKCAVEGRLFISNLPKSFHDGSVMCLLKTVGPVKSVCVHYNEIMQPLGTAQVVFYSKEDALRAIMRYNGFLIDNIPLAVQIVTAEVPPHVDEMEPMRLFISGLNYEVNSLQYLFGQVGGQLIATIHYGQFQQPLGTADIHFWYGPYALKALREFSGYKIRGQPMRVEMLTSYTPPGLPYCPGGV